MLIIILHKQKELFPYTYFTLGLSLFIQRFFTPLPGEKCNYINFRGLVYKVFPCSRVNVTFKILATPLSSSNKYFFVTIMFLVFFGSNHSMRLFKNSVGESIGRFPTLSEYNSTPLVNIS